MKNIRKDSTFHSVISALLIMCLLVVPFEISYAVPTQDPVATAIRDIVAGKEQVQGYVLDIKDKFKDTSAPEYVEARKRYRSALGNYNGWVAAVKAAIRNGKKKDLLNDPAYKKLGDDASKSLKNYIDYVESKTQQSKGVMVIVTGIIDIGFKIWNGYKDRTAKDRQAEADAFEKDAKWKQWEEIKAESK